MKTSPNTSPVSMGRLDIDVRLERTAEGTLVALEGELDLATAPRIRTLLGELVEDDPNLIVDLQDVGFVDSTGLGILARAWSLARARGGNLQLRNLTRPVRRALEISGLERVIGS